MKNRSFHTASIMMGLTLMAIQCHAQSVYEPYAFTTFSGIVGDGSADDRLTSARFGYPNGVAMDNAGNVYVADSSKSMIRKVTPAGVATTLAGLAGNDGSADGIGGAARFNYPSGVAIDNAGNLYVADYGNSTIRKVTPEGVVTTLAGLAGSVGSADGAGATARFFYPSGVAQDSASNIYVADTYNSTIRKVTPEGVVTTLAGTAGRLNIGSADGTGSAARFHYPSGVALNSAGDIYVADTGNNSIRKVTKAGVVTTLAGLVRLDDSGNSVGGSADGTGSAAQFNQPFGLAVDARGNLYVTDRDNSTIRKVTPEGVVTTVAGLAGSVGSTDGTGRAARFNHPRGVAVDSAGNFYVADTENQTIRKGHPANVPVVSNTKPVASPQILDAPAKEGDLVITFSASDLDLDSLSLRITALPRTGKLYQFINGVRGAEITASNTTVSDPAGRIIFAPASDGLGEPDTSFAFTANDGQADSMPALVIIVGNEPRFEFAKPQFKVSEGGNMATIEVRRIGAAESSARVDYTTTDGTAIAGQDYTSNSGTLLFAVGESSKVINVPILNDGTIERDESFSIALKARAGDLRVAPPGVAEVTIQDDDSFNGLPGRELNPVLVGRWPEFHQGPAADVAVAGNYAYVGGFGLKVIDMSNPAQPRQVGKFYETTFVGAIAISGNYAFLPDFNMGLQVLDISNPIEPVRIGQAKDALKDGYWDPRGLEIEGQRAFVIGVGNNNSGLRLWIYNVSNPVSPQRLGTFATDSGTPVAVSIAGGHAYIAGGPGGLSGNQGGAALTVIDVRDPANPRAVGRYGPGLSAGGLALSGSHVYLTGLADAVTVLDIADPGNPRRVGGLAAPFQGSSAAITAGVLTVAGWRQDGQRHTLETIDLSDPVRPRLLGSADIRGEAIQSKRIFTAGARVYVAAHWEGLQMFDISQPQSPTRIGIQETSGSTSGVAVMGHYAFVANGTDGLRILDVANPAQPVAVARYDTSSSVQSVALTGNHALLGDAGWGGTPEGIVVLDVSNPTRPSKVQTSAFSSV